jgi:hypothetical protein
VFDRWGWPVFKGLHTSIRFPDPPDVPTELPLLGVARPNWTAEAASALARQFEIRTEPRDAGPWLIAGCVPVCGSRAWVPLEGGSWDTAKARSAAPRFVHGHGTGTG